MKPAIASVAYLLISHGSRDPRPKEAMTRLAALVRSRLERSLASSPADNQQTSQRANRHVVVKDVTADERHQSGRTVLLTRPRIKPDYTGLSTPRGAIVGTASLEYAPTELSHQIFEFGQRLVAAGVEELKLLPVFLMAGVHVMEDLPAEIAKAKKLLGDSIKLTLCPHLGGEARMIDILNRRIESTPAEATLLVAHGSRRPRGNRRVKAIGQQLNTEVAYWAIAPDLEEKVIELMQKGAQRIAILPYFLFAGGITDAITHRTEELAERFPKIKFRLLPTLGATDEVADVAVNLLQA